MKQHIKLVEEFKTSLQEVLAELSDNDNIVYSSYIDSAYELNAIVMIHEYSIEVYSSIHSVMQDLHTRLSNKLGHLVCISHDFSDDNVILIHGDEVDSEPYNSNTCCKHTTITVCNNINEHTLDMYKSIAKAANKIAQETDSTVTKVLERLDWDKNIQSQLIDILVNI